MARQIHMIKMSFFFLQQFITQSVRADHGSYFITTYRQTESTLKQKKEKEKKRRDKKKPTKQNKKKLQMTYL